MMLGLLLGLLGHLHGAMFSPRRSYRPAGMAEVLENWVTDDLTTFDDD